MRIDLRDNSEKSARLIDLLKVDSGGLKNDPKSPGLGGWKKMKQASKERGRAGTRKKVMIPN